MAGHDQAMITEDLRRAPTVGRCYVPTEEGHGGHHPYFGVFRSSAVPLPWVDAMSQRRRGMAGHDQAMITEDLRRAPTVGRCHVPTEEGHGGS